MKEKCISCGSCGMPLLNPQDHAFGDEQSELCIHCIRGDGTPKDYKEVLRGTADHFKQSQGMTEQAALAMAHELLDQLPYWKNKILMKCTPLSISINAPFEKAFAFISNPENLPLYSSFVKRIFKNGDVWMGETTEGVLPHRFIVNEKFGIFDAVVTEPNGFELHVYARKFKSWLQEPESD